MLMARLRENKTVYLGKDKFWVCKKCRLIRADKITHKHYVTLPDPVLEKLNELDKKLEEGKHENKVHKNNSLR